MIRLISLLVSCLAVYAFYPVVKHNKVSISGVVTNNFCSHGHRRPLFAFKENEREEQMRLQQEMLARRKNKTKMKEYFETVEKKREATAKESKKNQWAKSSNEEDPLEKWKQAKEKGEIKDLGYEAEPPKASSLFGLNIIVPLNPIGVPKYDDGERFDLRLPYAEVSLNLY